MRDRRALLTESRSANGKRGDQGRSWAAFIVSVTP